MASGPKIVIMSCLFWQQIVIEVCGPGYLVYYSKVRRQHQAFRKQPETNRQSPGRNNYQTLQPENSSMNCTVFQQRHHSVSS